MGRKHGDEQEDSTVRLDKWLWAARFFKTRSLAQAAIDGGKVYIDDVRAKASRAVQPGQMLRILSPRGEFIVEVAQVRAQRGSPTIAETMYRETAQSLKAREDLVAMRRLSRVAAPPERPNTQDRRILRRIKEGE